MSIGTVCQEREYEQRIRFSSPLFFSIFVHRKRRNVYGANDRFIERHKLCVDARICSMCVRMQLSRSLQYLQLIVNKLYLLRLTGTFVSLIFCTCARA